jgi:hypothetical protein
VKEQLTNIIKQYTGKGNYKNRRGTTAVYGFGKRRSERPR